MKRYQLAWITIPQYETGKWSKVRLGSTDPKTLDALFTQIRDIAPHFAILTASNIQGDCSLDGHIIQSELKLLDDKDKKINFWIIQKLLEAGWEPFSVMDIEMDMDRYMYFRRGINDSDDASNK